MKSKTESFQIFGVESLLQKKILNIVEYTLKQQLQWGYNILYVVVSYNNAYYIFKNFFFF